MKTKQFILILAFLGMFVQIDAQKNTSPTLEQTMSFISLKCMNLTWTQKMGESGDWFCNYYKGFVTANDKIYLKDKTLYVTYKSSTDAYEELIISLNLIEGFSFMEKEKTIRLYSSKPFLTINSNIMKDKPLYSDKNIYLTIKEEDAQKVYKAFKHLLELLDVKLNDDIF